MARNYNRLGVKQVEALVRRATKAQVVGDGGGLYLRIRPSGSSWVFVDQSGGKRREIAIASIVGSDVELGRAREIAGAMRAAITEGRDPREALPRIQAEKAKAEKASAKTFGEFAEAYIASVEDGWRNEVHRTQWRNSLRDHAAGLRDKLVAEVNTDDVLEVLRPIWLTKPETASRVRGRIEKILAAAKALGLRPRDAANPALWRGHLDVLLPKQSKLSRGHHAALPWRDAPAFMKSLRARPALAARCLEFVILTAARSGEALLATWGEIDWFEKTWTVPAERMKAGKAHIVPLPAAAVTVLEALRPEKPKSDARVFAIDGATRSNMAMTMLLRRMDRSDLTVHGMRSTFRDWAGDNTTFPREIVEAALAHTIGSKVEAAYRRGTAVERRRTLMDDWAKFLLGEVGTDEVSAESAVSIEVAAVAEKVKKSSKIPDLTEQKRAPRRASARQSNPAQVPLFETS